MTGCSKPTVASVEIVSDGSGGAVVAWSQGDSHVQRLDEHGEKLWKDVVVCSSRGPTGTKDMADLGGNGVVLAWADTRNSTPGHLDDLDIYAQRVGPQGEVLWDPEGLPIAVALGYQESPVVVSDDDNQVIVVWRESLLDGGRAIRAKKVGLQGENTWDNEGVVVCTYPAVPIPPFATVSDGQGGVIVVWEDERENFSSIYAQRVDSAGNPLWAENGVPLAPGRYNSPEIIADGQHGAIIAWRAGHTDTARVYAQRVDGDGTLLWAGEGLFVCVPTLGIWSMATDGEGGALFAWEDMDPQAQTHTLHAKRVNGEGEVLWEKELAVSHALEESFHVALTGSGTSGAIIVWRLGASPHTGGVVYAQKLDAKGDILWAKDGVQVFSQTLKYQGIPQVISDGYGGAIITAVTGKSDSKKDLLHAQRLDAEGNAVWENGVRITP